MISCDKKANIGIVKAIQLETDAGETTSVVWLEPLAAEGEAPAPRLCGSYQPVMALGPWTKVCHGASWSPKHDRLLVLVSVMDI